MIAGPAVNADEEGEVGDVHAPGHLVAHAGDDESVDQLLRVGVEPEQADDGQQAHPGVVAPVAHEGDAGAPLEENQVVAGRGDHLSK